MGGHPINRRADTGPSVIRITKTGWLYIILTIFIGFAAVNTGNNLLYLVVSALLSFMGISGFFGKRNLSEITVVLEFPEEIFAQTPCDLKVTLINHRKILPAFLLKVCFLGQDVLFPFIGTGGKASAAGSCTFAERGIAKVADIRLCSVFPFNFFVRCRKVEQEVTVTVFPKLKKCSFPFLSEKDRKARGEQTVDRSGLEADILSLRNYISGDPLKYIHWKASARTEELKTKELSSLTHQPLVIELDHLPIRDVEEKLSCVAYLIVTLFRRSTPIGLRIKGILLKPRLSGHHPDRPKSNKIMLLKALALYDKK